ncbi:DUF3726 domain-containing protein [Pseudorhodoplanes sp.]|uniref:DUF3726 domain-containing protein n=1 Tax=Pseudorhodoplanes sp. TaxID=1934341 RepID=UPI002BDA6A32|nr:DUF3726 domain-containing protein [Pseudorhodoplanes sp.]HWV53110.1 DUF3726 domain-containing protein [Pseudorhodoplanes sp.]
MTWSLNELEAETRKAVRGAGLSWGLSEEGAKAVRWLAAHGADPLPALSDVLERHDQREKITPVFDAVFGHWHADASICPITLGATLSDYADRLTTDTLVAGPVARPLLLAPFVAAAARILKRSLELDVNGMRLTLDEKGDPAGDLSILDVPDASEVRCAIARGQPSAVPARPASTRGIETDPQSWARIASYVHRTYVPASERSRREGAGAGMIDND